MTAMLAIFSPVTTRKDAEFHQYYAVCHDIGDEHQLLKTTFLHGEKNCPQHSGQKFHVY